ncbi:MAG: cell division protein FtsQ [Gammaproteobacteria bacterium]|jgi:cell division protein FtsQ
MLSFRKTSAQAKKKTVANKDFEFRWRGIYTWLLIIVPLFGGISYLVQNHTFLPIKTIQLSGSFQHINQQEVETALRPFVGEGFFSLDIQKVRNILRDKPWAESVSIRRVWPDRVLIQIVEKKPVARWDEDHLISDKANIYLANVDAFQALPRVHGANVQAERLLIQYYDFAERFSALGETVRVVNIDSRGAIDIELAQGFKIKLGREEVERKIGRLVSIYQQQIKPRRTEIQQLDLRYSNGFAVAWKKEALVDRDEASLWRNNNV